MNAQRGSRRHTVACRLIPFLIAVALPAGEALAVGTDAGRSIDSAATATFVIGGVPQPPVQSNATSTFVDELIDVVVVSDDAAAVGVVPSQPSAVLQFSVTNTGNGSERFRLIADATVAGDDFDPALNQLYLESNGLPGLQTGGGGDASYLPPGGDPLLAEDQVQIVYVDSAITGTPPQNAVAAVQLRAVAGTLLANAATDDPASPAWPAPGTAWLNAGDANELGTGNVSAVIGSSHALGNLLVRAEGRYQVSAAVVDIVKTAVAVADPFGGATVVPGSLITYQIDVTVSGSGTAEDLTITDVLPPELEYQPATLTVSSLPAGEDPDDDLAPAGTDNTGFVSASQTLSARLGDVAGGAATINITFVAAIR